MWWCCVIIHFTAEIQRTENCNTWGGYSHDQGLHALVGGETTGAETSFLRLDNFTGRTCYTLFSGPQNAGLAYCQGRSQRVEQVVPWVIWATLRCVSSLKGRSPQGWLRPLTSWDCRNALGKKSQSDKFPGAKATESKLEIRILIVTMLWDFISCLWWHECKHPSLR